MEIGAGGSIPADPTFPMSERARRPMPDTPARQPSRIEPALAWTALTDAPLLGLALAREAGTILAWDEGEQIYLIDLQGERVSMSRAPDRILAGAISDNGSLVALLGKGPRLWVLSGDLEPIADRLGPPEAAALAVDPHGRYVAVGSKLNHVQLYNRHGRQAGRFETKQGQAHLAFVPSKPFLVGASGYGLILGAELEPRGSNGQLRSEVVWEQALLSNVGRLATTGDGGMVLASCYTHGVQRYDLDGRNEGSYHLGGTASLAVPDFAGRSIAVATTEGELAILSGSGTVRWRTALPRPASALEFDALGRFLVYGLPTGEVTRIDLDGGSRTSKARARTEGDDAEPAPARRGRRQAPVRAPDWTQPVAQTDEQAETAVVAVLDEPPRIAFLTGKNRIQVFNPAGEHLGQGPELLGVGRVLRTSTGWIAAATDRNVALLDARRGSVQVLDLSLVELSHIVVRPDTYGLALVQERDRIGRATPAGRWIWRRELKAPVEDLAIGPGGATAVTTEDGKLLIFDAAGEPAGSFATDRAEALGLVEAPPGSPGGVAWISLARRFQTLLGHDLSGRVVWQAPLPWEAWQLHPIGPLLIVTAPDGRALAFDGSGKLRGQSREGHPRSVFALGPDVQALTITPQGVHLISADLSGRVAWRAVADAPLGPLAAGASGVAALIGRSLAWFGTAGAP